VQLSKHSAACASYTLQRPASACQPRTASTFKHTSGACFNPQTSESLAHLFATLTCTCAPLSKQSLTHHVTQAPCKAGKSPPTYCMLLSPAVAEPQCCRQLFRLRLAHQPHTTLTHAPPDKTPDTPQKPFCNHSPPSPALTQCCVSS
jgi:hypothetical protein